MLERLALGEAELDGDVGRRRLGVVRVLGDEHGELAPLDELLDERPAVGIHHPRHLLAQRLGVSTRESRVSPMLL